MYSENDFELLNWEEYQKAVDSVTLSIQSFCNKNNIVIDMIVPIIRGGGVLCISLSHVLNVIDIYPCQYKNKYYNINSQVEYGPICILSTIESIKDKQKEHIVLVTEGNHASGKTAQTCINHICDLLPNSRVIYVSIGRDYAHKDPLNNTIFECYGFLTNETESLSFQQCETIGVKNKFIVYPWENLKEEMIEVNDFQNNEVHLL